MKKCNECNEPGIELNQMKGKIDTKWNNLISFDDFEKSWNPEGQKKTKRTEVGLDVVKEGVVHEGIINGKASKYYDELKNSDEFKKSFKLVKKEVGPDMIEVFPTTLRHLIVKIFSDGAKWAIEEKEK